MKTVYVLAVLAAVVMCAAANPIFENKEPNKDLEKISQNPTSTGKEALQGKRNKRATIADSAPKSPGAPEAKEDLEKLSQNPTSTGEEALQGKRNKRATIADSALKSLDAPEAKDNESPEYYATTASDDSSRRKRAVNID